MQIGELVRAITTGVTAFSATNIDDIVILLLFFAQVDPKFRRWHIVTGQYLGFIAIIIASLPGFFGGLILSQQWIGLLGLIPIAIGFNSLLNQTNDWSEEVEVKIEQSDLFGISNFISPQVWGVAGVTLANGADNMSLYTPLFASTNLRDLIVIILVFLVLVGVWCYTAYQLVNYPKLARIFKDYTKVFVPYLLIILGSFIILKMKALNLLKLIDCCLCLMVLVRRNGE